MPNPLNPSHAALAIAVNWQRHVSFWLNVSTAALFIVALLLAWRKARSQPGDLSFGASWLFALGPAFFAVPLALFGMQHFSELNVVKEAVPAYMPDRIFWAAFVGVALIAASLSIITGKMARLAALLLGIMFFIFVLLIHIPNVWTNPGDRFALAILFRDLSLGGAALCLAATLTDERHAQFAPWLALVGRCLFAIAMIVFGVEHFSHPQFAPGVPLEKLMPDWLPAQIVWAWVTGAILIVCGASILINKRGRTAGIVLGLLFLALVLFIYLPMEILHPSTAISGELDYVADTLIFSGAALFIAESLSRKNPPALAAT